MGEIIVIRHGQTEWSLSGRHAGRTDVALTEAGEAAAAGLAPRLADRRLVAVFSSPLGRAMRTAELAGLTTAVPDPDLLEWDYGGYEGLTADQIRSSRPGWDLWRDGVVPGDADHPGEDLAQVAARADAVLDRIRPLLGQGDVAVVAHGHLARVLTVRWLGLAPSASRLLGHPHPGTLAFLAVEDGQPVVSAWNLP
ncbi:histidine phosphatase family protein [Streptacidiphilus jiangxiensis]|uniref:Probable phosphoglycerate mutase n=1 Tax=Streptacidiphilus jiangxiensis TaxID=235985 RepID=A0A1H7MS36_STRJI|nr:histidine phosphatase family protein [Streptacidiphilus jiangxiensis]SEL14072.1 probable phosphoglycerate mutase [Streptacidiphilus jiangxiensis]